MYTVTGQQGPGLGTSHGPFSWADVQPDIPLPRPVPGYIFPNERSPEWFAEQYWRGRRPAASDMNAGLFPLGALFAPGARMPEGGFVQWDWTMGPAPPVDPQLGHLYGLTFGKPVTSARGMFLKLPLTGPDDPNWQYRIGYEPPRTNQWGTSAPYYYAPANPEITYPRELDLSVFTVTPIVPLGTGPSEAQIRALNPAFRRLVVGVPGEEDITAADRFDFLDPDLYGGESMPEQPPESPAPPGGNGNGNGNGLPGEPGEPGGPGVTTAGLFGGSSAFVGMLAVLIMVAVAGARR